MVERIDIEGWQNPGDARVRTRCHLARGDSQTTAIPGERLDLEDTSEDPRSPSACDRVPHFRAVPALERLVASPYESRELRHYQHLEEEFNRKTSI